MKAYKTFLNEQNSRNFFLKQPFIVFKENKLQIENTSIHGKFKYIDYSAFDYSGLIRYLWFIWIRNVNTDIELINRIKIELDNDRIFNQFPNHINLTYMVADAINIKKSLLKVKTTQLDILKKIYEKRNEICTPENFLKWYNVISIATYLGTKTEKMVIKQINNSRIPNISNAYAVDNELDIDGVDIIAHYNYNNEKKRIQIKRLSEPSEYSFVEDSRTGNTAKYIITLKNSSLSFKKTKNYDLLFIYDVKAKKIYSINNSQILSFGDVDENDVGKNDVGKNDVGKSDVDKNDVGKSDVDKSDVDKSDVDESDIVINLKPIRDSWFDRTFKEYKIEKIDDDDDID